MADPSHRGRNVPHDVWAPCCRRDQSHRQKLVQRAAHIVPRSPRLRHAALNGRSSGYSAVLELVASSRRYEQVLALGKEAFIDHVLLTHLARLDEIIALVHVLRGKMVIDTAIQRKTLCKCELRILEVCRASLILSDTTGKTSNWLVVSQPTGPELTVTMTGDIELVHYHPKRV